MNRSRNPVNVFLLALSLTMPVAAVAEDAPKISVLRVCADPNNLPFSDATGKGFENRLAELIGGALGAKVEYTWWAQRRGFIKNTLQARLCDVVMGVPSDFPLALTTQPYYRSSYVLLYRKDRDYGLRSLDDPLLRKLRIGVHVMGNESPPPALALAKRGIINNVVGYSIYGDYRTASPPARLIEAVAKGDVDVAIAWGPLAGYFAKQSRNEMVVVSIADLPASSLPFQFSISMGVRKNDRAMKTRLDSVLEQKRHEIRALLEEYGVPLVDAPLNAASMQR
jgi:mxaJ protein